MKRERARELSARLRRAATPGDLEIRVGLNTGYCTVGVFGGDVIRAYKAVGFAVNIAAGLQAAAGARLRRGCSRAAAMRPKRRRKFERRPAG